jgi:hypothetical protein
VPNVSRILPIALLVATLEIMVQSVLFDGSGPLGVLHATETVELSNSRHVSLSEGLMSQAAAPFDFATLAASHKESPGMPPGLHMAKASDSTVDSCWHSMTDGAFN